MSFIHMPKPVLHCALSPPFQNTAEDKVSNCSLQASTACRPSSQSHLWNQSFYLLVYFLQQKAGSYRLPQSTPAHLSLPLQPQWYLCLLCLFGWAKNQHNCAQDGRVGVRALPCIGPYSATCLYSSGTPSVPSLTSPRLIPIPTHPHLNLVSGI